MIKVIAFDLGEVVLTNDWHYDCPEKFEAYSNYFGITYDQMEIGWNAAWPLYETGKISEDDFWKLFLTKAGAIKSDIKKAKYFWRKYFDAKPEIIEILKQLKKSHELVVISSTGKEWLDYKINKYNLNLYFSAYITTCDTGFIKTDIKIYEFAIQKLKLKPEELLFIDDKEQVTNIASQIGIQTLVFKDAKGLSRDLYNLSLLL